MPKGDEWVWVVIQDPGENEQFLGQHDSEKDESYIPAFLGKETAQRSLKSLSTEEGHQYEVQAIRFDDLSERAAENGFMVFILSESGRILERAGE
jgi:hypothetical protein